MNISSPTVPITEIPLSFVYEGYHIARCVGLVELGTIQIMNFKEGTTRWQHQVRLTWELPQELRNFDKRDPLKLEPHLISKEYASRLYNRSHLRRHLIQWLGDSVTARIDEEAFDPFKVIGKDCQVKVVNKVSRNNKKYQDVEEVYALTKAAAPPQKSKTFVLTFDAWDEDLFNSLPLHVQNKIIGSQEFVKRFGVQPKRKVKKGHPINIQDHDEPPF